MNVKWWLLAGLTVLAPGALRAQDTARTAPAPAVKRNPDVISEEEIRDALSSTPTAFDLIDRMRPNWLKPRGASSIRANTVQVQVYVGGLKRGGPSALQEIPLNSVREIRHLRGTDATQRFGMGHESGAILVTLK